MTTSLLEALNDDRTVVDKARFYDPCTGDSVKSWWTETQSVGSATFTTSNEVDGGYIITTGGGATDSGQLNFNNISQFEETGCIIQFQGKRNTTNTLLEYGLANVLGQGGTQLVYWRDYPQGTAYKRLTSAGASGTSIDSVIAINTQWTDYKIELNSTQRLGTINGSLRVTITDNPPTLPLQPRFRNDSNTTATAKTTQLRNVEIWNT